MLKDQKDLLSAFNAHGVEYLVVGGQAVNAYGVPRLTKDLDVLIRSSPKNSEAVFRALAAFGAPLYGSGPEDFRDHPNDVFQLGVEPSRVDILQSIPAVAFDEAWENRVRLEIDSGLSANFISRDDLLRNKLECARPQDLADAHQLQQMAEEE